MRIATDFKLDPSVTCHLILLLVQCALCVLLVCFLAPVVEYVDHLPLPTAETREPRKQSARQLPVVTEDRTKGMAAAHTVASDAALSAEEAAQHNRRPLAPEKGSVAQPAAASETRPASAARAAGHGPSAAGTADAKSRMPERALGHTASSQSSGGTRDKDRPHHEEVLPDARTTLSALPASAAPSVWLPINLPAWPGVVVLPVAPNAVPNALPQPWSPWPVPMAGPQPLGPVPMALPVPNFSASARPLPVVPESGLAGPRTQGLANPGGTPGIRSLPDTAPRQQDLTKAAGLDQAEPQAAFRTGRSVSPDDLSAGALSAHPSRQTGNTGMTGMRKRAEETEAPAVSPDQPDAPGLAASQSTQHLPVQVQSPMQPAPGMGETGTHECLNSSEPTPAATRAADPRTTRPVQASKPDEGRTPGQPPVPEAGTSDRVSELLGRYPIEHQARSGLVPAPVRFLPRKDFARMAGLQLTLPEDAAASSGTPDAAAAADAAKPVQPSPLKQISGSVLERVFKKLSAAPQVERQAVEELLAHVPGIGLRDYAQKEHRTMLLVLTQPDCRHCHSMQAFLARLRQELSFPVLFLPVGEQPSSLACYTKKGATLSAEQETLVRSWLGTATAWLQKESQSQAPYVPTFVWITDGEAHRSTLTRTELAVLASYLNARVRSLDATDFSSDTVGAPASTGIGS